MRLISSVLVAGAVPLVTAPAGLQITKSVAVVSDDVDPTTPRYLPGAVVDVILRGSTSTNSVAGVLVRDDLPDGVVMQVGDLGDAGSGPVGFVDGSLLGTGLLGSGLAYSFKGLASGTDGLNFSRNGIDWSYVPHPDAAGYDPEVRAIRVALTGRQSANTYFQLRYRERVR